MRANYYKYFTRDPPDTFVTSNHCMRQLLNICASMSYCTVCALFDVLWKYALIFQTENIGCMFHLENASGIIGLKNACPNIITILNVITPQDTFF